MKDLRKIWSDSCSVMGMDGKRRLDPVLVIASLDSLKGPYLALDQGIKLEGISDDVWTAISNLRRVPIPGVTHPYLMMLLANLVTGEVNEADALEVCKVLESFFVRRGFVGLEPTGLHSVFKKLWEVAGSDPEKVSSNIETRTISFPNDDEVRRAICEKALYKRKIEKFVLWFFEIFLQQSSYSQLSYLPDITKDHVLPKSWQGEWKNLISETEHSIVVDLWGNLVPLSQRENSAKGAKSYAEARELLQHETAFATTKRFLAENEVWGRDEILDRSRVLADWAINNWVRPKSAASVETLI